MVTRTKTQPEHGPQTLPFEERRRSQRVIIRVPVKLHLTISGQPLVVSAHTVSVNDHGAMLVCPRPVDAEQKFTLQNEQTRQQISCRVTRAPKESPSGYLIPVEFSTPGPNFWQIAFPPTGWRPPQD